MIVNLASSQWIEIDGVIVQLALHVLKVPIGQLVNVPLQFAVFLPIVFKYMPHSHFWALKAKELLLKDSLSVRDEKIYQAGLHELNSHQSTVKN